jgi:hypothetical protein
VTEHKNVYEAIQAVYGEVGYVQKETSKQLNYSYASEAGFVRALRPAFINHKLILRVSNIGIVNLENYETAKGTAMTRAVVTGQVEFIHTPTVTAIQVQALGEGADAGDKAVNKAMTDFYKYALRQAFMIETGDDPDAEPTEERKVKGMKEEAESLGGVSRKSSKVEMTLEEAGAITTEEGVPYSKLPLEELTNRFNGISGLKKKNPEKFTPEHATKLAAIKLLIGAWHNRQKETDQVQKELYGND